ncbi:hypothetical protein MMC22_010813 [Lobaria immixta]|nr:hypothetical protein [Lobaria immixta]
MLVHESPDFEIFTSIRGDIILVESELNTELSTTSQPSQFYMLRYHRDRMLAAAEEFGWSEAIEALNESAGLLLLERSLFEHLEHEYSNSIHQNPLKVCQISSCHHPATSMVANHNP